MFGLGYIEITIIAVVFLLLFGGKRIPMMMRSIGESITSFKQGIHDADDPNDSPTTPSS